MGRADWIRLPSAWRLTHEACGLDTGRQFPYHTGIMRPFALVILDLDGTILNQYKRAPISPAVQAAIAAVQAAGVPLTIGTGRTLDYLHHQFPGELNLAYPAVTTQGAVIGEPATGRNRLAFLPARTGQTIVLRRGPDASPPVQVPLQHSPFPPLPAPP